LGCGAELFHNYLILLLFRNRDASGVGASRGCMRSLAIAFAFWLGASASVGCSLFPSLKKDGWEPAPATAPERHPVPPQLRLANGERYCAWYGEAREGVLYFGFAPFWSAMHDAGGDPTADLLTAGPQPIGRFELAARARAIETFEVGEPGARSGVWDVLPHPNGRLYFTTFYEDAGWLDLATGAVTHLSTLGRGLNELALGPRGRVIASRYGGYGDDPTATGSLVVLEPYGALAFEAPLAAPDGFVVAPKTVAYDPLRRRYWIATDLVRRRDDAPDPASEHPAIVLDASGREIARVDVDDAGRELELQFVRFDRDGRGVGAVVAGSELWLVDLSGGGVPSELLDPRRGLLLDSAFARAFDFVQDVAFGPQGEVLVTRWSGAIHVVRGARAARVDLPRTAEPGLFYAAALTPDGLVCATVCDDEIAIECAPLDAAAPSN